MLEFVRISLVIIVLALVFFSGTLLNFPATYYSSADMLQGTPVFAIDAQRRSPHNYVLGDDTYTYLPWIEFSWRSLRQGVFPLWNPYNAGGRPLIANMQSSIFFPSQWPSFFFGQRVGLLARCFLHLYLAGLFSYYFFRSLKVQATAALVGAIAFMFGGMMVVWLYNELSATFLLFPLLLLVIERRLSRVTAPLRFVVELSLAVMLQIFGGHPETIYLNVCLATLYLLYRLVTDRANWPGWANKIQLLGLYVAGGMWGAILGAVQLFPFAEYFLNSASLVGRSVIKQDTSLLPQYLLSFILPDPFGNPTFGTKLDFSRPNYSEVSGSYIGLTVFSLAICSLGLRRHRSIVRFFWLLILVIIQLVYKVGPLYQLFMQIQPVTILYNRLAGYAGFFLITLMVFTLDSLSSNNWLTRLKLSRQIALIAAAGGIFMILCLLLFWWFNNSNLVPFEQPKVSNFEVREFEIISGLFALSLVGLTFLLGGPKSKQVGVVVLILAVFGQLGWFGSNYRAAIPQAYFYPDTPITKELQKAGGRIAPAGTPGFLPAEANIWYGLEQVNGYDSLEVRWFDELLQASKKRWPDWDNAVPLNLFNIKQVLTSSTSEKFQASVAKCCSQLLLTSKQRGINIYDNQAYEPTYRLVYNSVSKPEQQALQSLLDGQINLLDTLVFISGEAPARMLNNNGPINSPPVKVLNKTANQVTLQVSNLQDGFLYIDQTYFPGWEARINGQPAKLYRANFAFTALPVGQGELNIELVYNPVSFRMGILMTILGLFLTGLVANHRWLRNKLNFKAAVLGTSFIRGKIELN